MLRSFASPAPNAGAVPAIPLNKTDLKGQQVDREHLSSESLRQRAAYYQRIGEKNMTPLWEVLHALVTPQPVDCGADTLALFGTARRGACRRPADHRRRSRAPCADTGKPGVAWSVVHHADAVYKAADDLPGEEAPAHRHTRSAFRLVLDGEGADTAVDGERSTMRRGDFIVTPPGPGTATTTWAQSRWSGLTGLTSRSSAS